MLRPPRNSSLRQQLEVWSFSAKGDSGSGIIDGLGRLGGLLTGGDGGTNSGSNITYATPVSFILDTLGLEATIEANLAA